MIVIGGDVDEPWVLVQLRTSNTNTMTTSTPSRKRAITQSPATRQGQKSPGLITRVQQEELQSIQGRSWRPPSCLSPCDQEELLRRAPHTGKVVAVYNAAL